ncbi:hypothetical protein [Phormidesmis priestleyi]|uniref:hypothetical protein n=1 Tax=Phormidesmis priestleyi TaxID=268141 RepID=UPI0011609D3E|nr:hypothetical protein [Phormidesmis priestleyi]
MLSILWQDSRGYTALKMEAIAFSSGDQAPNCSVCHPLERGRLPLQWVSSDRAAGGISQSDVEVEPF